jgi:hypothetical protein
MVAGHEMGAGRPHRPHVGETDSLSGKRLIVEIVCRRRLAVDRAKIIVK